MIKLKTLISEIIIPVDNGLKIDNINDLSDEQLEKISGIMKQKGYDSRGGEDAKRAISTFIERHRIPNMDFSFLDYAVYPDWIDTIKTVLNKIDNPKKSLTSYNPKQVFTAAKRMFGMTNNINKAGYILPDGYMLDFSHGNYYRVADHREIMSVFIKLNININSANSTSSTPYMEEFIQIGAIRINGGHPEITMANIPTKQQWDKIGMIHANNNGNLYIDFKSDKYGMADREYPPDTPLRRVISDTNYFYKHGELPAQSITHLPILKEDIS